MRGLNFEKKEAENGKMSPQAAVLVSKKANLFLNRSIFGDNYPIIKLSKFLMLTTGGLLEVVGP